MKFHLYGTNRLVELPKGTTVKDLKSLASFNRIIRNYLVMCKLKNKK